MGKITEIRATPVSVPVTRVGAFSRTKRTHVLRTVVEIETDEGLLGLGETRGEWSAAIIAERLAPRLVGKEVSVEEATAICLPERFDYGFPELLLERTAFAGLELALWDLAGKRAGLPLYRLLGGPVRERAPFVAYAYAVDPDEGHAPEDVAAIMAAIAARSMAKSGADLFEYKVGLWPLECERTTFRAIREAIGAAPGIALDANMGYSLDEALRLVEGLADLGLDNFEEPVAGLAQLARFREASGIAVSTHCYDVEALAAYPAIDAVVSDLHLHGGIAGMIALIEAVADTGRRIWLRSSWELGPSWAAMCHLGMARNELDRPAQALIDWVADDLVLGEPWLVKNGGVRPPEAPGLGVELDRNAMARYATT